jgi:cyclopropane-fatty-acyl-phospholipid synthase
MTFGKNMVDVKDMDINADKNSNEYITALLAKYFPGSWLPYGSEMIIRNAEPFFKLINISSGRLDYIETTNQWRKRIWKFSVEKYLLFLRLLPEVFFNKDFRLKLEVLRSAANKKCFEREIMDHFRIVFEKK